MILDACGVGELPDAARFGDEGSNTLGNCAKAVGGLHLPNSGRLGLGNIIDIKGVPPVEEPYAYFGKMAEISAGKDSTIGHWELAGIISPRPFPVFPDGFPEPLIREFVKAVGREVIGNKAASGTEIIAELGAEHLRTGKLIVYTSADSVFQVAAHTDVVPLEKLYKYCRAARGILTGEHAVSRVIARPFIGQPGAFTRTADRVDFSVEPPPGGLLEKCEAAGLEVITIGKVDYLFAGKGVTRANHTRSNAEGIESTKDILAKKFRGLLFINLVDFDMLWGHRNDAAAFAAGLEFFDKKLPEILSQLAEDDLFMITADHGCDPTTPSTDHSREYVPLLVYSKSFASSGENLGIRETFADIAASIAEVFDLPRFSHGKSFSGELR